MKTTIVVEDGKVTIQVDDGTPVEVKPGDVVIPIVGLDQAATESVKNSPPTVPQLKAPNGPINHEAEIISPPPPITDLAIPLPAPRTCVVCGGPIPQDAHARLKICSVECRREKQRRYAAGKYTKKGPTSKTARQDGVVDQYNHEHKPATPLHVDAPPADPEFRSKCCDAKVEIGDNDEPVCRGCGKSCGIYEVPFDDPWNCDACRQAGGLCRLHHSLEKDDGKTAPTFRHQA